jgi:hypothetical protein
MAANIKNPPITDPDNVPEIICDGPIYVNATPSLATLTFTHGRPDVDALFKKNNAAVAATVVRARVVLTTSNLVELRDLLNRIIQAPAPTVAAPAGRQISH